jgi:hypothetical protein
VREDATYTLAKALTGLGQEREPGELVLARLRCLRQTAAPQSASLLSGFNDALPYLDRAGLLEQGEAIARELADALRQMGGGHGNILFGAELNVARFTSRRGRIEEADPMFTALRSGPLPGGRLQGRLHLFYGSHLAAQGRFEEAEAEMFEAAKWTGDLRRGTTSAHADDILFELIGLYEAWRKPEKADEYRQMRAELWDDCPGPWDG